MEKYYLRMSTATVDLELSNICSKKYDTEKKYIEEIKKWIDEIINSLKKEYNAEIEIIIEYPLYQTNKVEPIYVNCGREFIMKFRKVINNFLY
ncbi:MAG: hypothetical protein ACTSW3_05620 [Promethearchaeota archaeon]